MTRGFTLLEVLLALALMALAAGATVSVLLPLATDTSELATELKAASHAERALDRIGHDLLIEHESMPRRRVAVGDGWLTLETRWDGERRKHRYDAETLSLESIDAELLENGRRLRVRVSDNGEVFQREYRVP
ncbi:MAG: prepilin-type N-terminal cleavage/methylation domain-containing protein [Phycisphaerales bacterium]|nr:prepilin-type N-terminal cleavage/methylation domain-containing protein [Phycisphaerales bacterium]